MAHISKESDGEPSWLSRKGFHKAEAPLARLWNTASPAFLAQSPNRSRHREPSAEITINNSSSRRSWVSTVCKNTARSVAHSPSTLCSLVKATVFPIRWKADVLNLEYHFLFRRKEVKINTVNSRWHQITLEYYYPKGRRWSQMSQYWEERLLFGCGHLWSPLIPHMLPNAWLL